MPETDFQALTLAKLRWHADTPVAPAFGDTYFAQDQGQAESRAVFLRGNRLPKRFTALSPRQDFVLGETGFGTGLNFLTAAACFLERAPPDSCLHYLAAEQHPLAPADLCRALVRAPGPGPAELNEELRRRWPPPAPGFHHRILAGGRIRLTLLFGDAGALLHQSRARVDAWFLDGFAPARNPAMWRPELFRELARLSRPGATLATYTAAGFVRRGLEEAGFRMKKVTGFGGKRHRLNGARAGATPTASTRPRRRVTVVGAGLAGATTARALAERGHTVEVLDAAGVAAGASGNHAGVLYTTPSGHPTPRNRFYQASYLQALDWMHRLGFPRSPDDGLLEGILQQPTDDHGARKLSKAGASGLWPRPLADFGAVGGEPRLRLPGGGFIHPPAWCAFLLDHPRIRFRQTRLMGLEANEPGWRLDTVDGAVEADTVVLAQAADALQLPHTAWLPLHRIRGQVTHVRATAASGAWRVPRCHRGYLTPALDGVHCVGATFDPRDTDPEPRAADDARNLETLRRYRPQDWRALGGEVIRVAGHRVGFRCQSKDFLPLVGPAVRDDGTKLPGLLLNLAHGARGITGTPLCAEVLAALLDDEPAPVDGELLEALLPKRFTLRT